MLMYVHTSRSQTQIKTIKLNAHVCTHHHDTRRLIRVRKSVFLSTVRGAKKIYAKKSDSNQSLSQLRCH